MSDEVKFQMYSASVLMRMPLRPRPKRGCCRVDMDRRPVKRRGERLHPILWRGRQWAVTTYGVEALDGCYNFEADRLDENLAAEHPHSWPEHMARKGWVDVEDFITAWLVAVTLHGVQPEPDLVKKAIARTPTRAAQTGTSAIRRRPRCRPPRRLQPVG